MINIMRRTGFVGPEEVEKTKQKDNKEKDEEESGIVDVCLFFNMLNFFNFYVSYFFH